MVDGWRVFSLPIASDTGQKALAAEARFPAAVKIALTTDLEYLQALATLYTNENRPADAQRVLAQAMALPFPDNGATLKAAPSCSMRAADRSQALRSGDQSLHADAY